MKIFKFRQFFSLLEKLTCTQGTANFRAHSLSADMPRDRSTVYVCSRDREPEALFAYM